MKKLLIALGLLGGLALPIAAQAAMTCSPSGDVCASVTRDRAGAVLQLDSLVPLEEPGVCVMASRGPVRCVALAAAPVRRGPVPLSSARLRVPSAPLDLAPGSYLAQFAAQGALVGSPLRFRLGGTVRGNRAGLHLAAPAEVEVGQTTTIVLSAVAGVESLRVLLSPLPGGGSCCGISADPAVRRLDAERFELRFAWPRTYFRCAGVQQCTRVPWGRRGRITVAGEPAGGIVARDVLIQRGPSAQASRPETTQALPVLL